MSDEIEERLRAALNAKAGYVTADRLSPGHVPGEDDIAPRTVKGRSGLSGTKWVIPLLAAAAIVAIATAGAVVLTSSKADHAPPGKSVAPTPTTSGPVIPTGSESATSPPPTSPAATTSATTPAQTTTSQPPPPSSVVIDLAGVTVTLPPSWHLSYASKNGLTGTCASPTSGGCALFVHRESTADTGSQITDWPVTGGCTPNNLTGWARPTIDGQPTEYRRFAAGCGQPAAEQWLVVTDPQVAFWHPIGLSDDTVRQAVLNAKLPSPNGPLPQRDRAYITAFTKHADGYHVTMQREVGLVSAAIAEPGATYSFVLPLANDMGLSLWCAEWKMPGYQPQQSCPMSALADQAAKGPHPGDGSLPINAVPMVVWTNGTTVSTFVTAASFPGGV